MVRVRLPFFLTAVLTLGILVGSGFAFAPSGHSSFSEPSPSKNVSGCSELVRTDLARALPKLPGLHYLRFAPDGTSVECLWGTLSSPSRESPEQAFLSFVSDHAALFHVSPLEKGLELKPRKQVSLGRTRHLSYQLFIDQIPVHEAFLSGHFGASGGLELIGSSIPAFDRVDSTCRLSARDASALAKKRWGEGIAGEVGTPDLVYVRQNAVLKKAFQVKFLAKNPFGEWELLIDAVSGKELRRRCFTLYAETVPPFAGKGTVFRHHPMSSSISEEPLPNLTTGKLTGLFVHVENEDHFAAHGNQGVYQYPVENTHFDEVMAYYQVNKAHDFFKSLGFDGLDIPLGVVVHVGEKLDNAYYAGWADAIFIGDGDRYWDLALEESIFYHEYSHAMVSRLAAMHFGEGGAMNEGQADYFAAALSNDPNIGEYIVSKCQRPYLRTLLNSTHYPEDIHNETHDDGMIWSATLWDLRTRIGGNDCDRLVLKSFYYLKDDPKFVDGLLALLQADKDHFNGAHQQAISEVFQKRGFSLQTPQSLMGRDLQRFCDFEKMHGNRFEK